MTKDNKKIIALRVILLILIIAWMITIFMFSNQNGQSSSGLSRKFTFWFINNEELLEYAERIIRKLAHFTIYFTGGLIVYPFTETFKNLNKKKGFICSISFGLLYAISDEIHQLYVPGRSGSPIDVYIDTLAFIIGSLVSLLILKLVKQKYEKSMKN